MVYKHDIMKDEQINAKCPLNNASFCERIEHKWIRDRGKKGWLLNNGIKF